MSAAFKDHYPPCSIFFVKALSDAAVWGIPYPAQQARLQRYLAAILVVTDRECLHHPADEHLLAPQNLEKARRRATEAGDALRAAEKQLAALETGIPKAYIPGPLSP